MKYICPVCGYDNLPEPPANYLICPSCGTEFGYTDFSTTHEVLFSRWLANGMKWHSKVFAPPPDWNPLFQTANREAYAKTSGAASTPSQVTLSGRITTEASLAGMRVQIFGSLSDLLNAIKSLPT